MTTNETKQNKPTDLNSYPHEPLADRDGPMTITLQETDYGGIISVS